MSKSRLTLLSMYNTHTQFFVVGFKTTVSWSPIGFFGHLVGIDIFLKHKALGKGRTSNIYSGNKCHAA